MAKTNVGLVNYAKAQLGKPYWYGTFGYTASEALYLEKKKQYPKYYNSKNYKQGWEHQYGQRVHDCVGLIKGYLWSETPTSYPKYKSSQDVSANGMLNVCKTKGKISSIPEVPGVLVFFDGHVGVYEGNGYVIEARGHDYGVVRTELSARPWKNWGYCPYITYNTSSVTETTTAKKSVSEIAKDIIDGAGEWKNCNGTARKNKLEKMGYDYEEVRAEINKQLQNGKTSYFKKYTGKSTSIVDALKSMNITSSFAYRKKIANANGIKAYTGLPKQNQNLLSLLKQGKLIKP